MSRFVVNNFCTDCQNFERNPSLSLKKSKQRWRRKAYFVKHRFFRKFQRKNILLNLGAGTWTKLFFRFSSFFLLGQSHLGVLMELFFHMLLTTTAKTKHSSRIYSRGTVGFTDQRTNFTRAQVVILQLKSRFKFLRRTRPKKSLTMKLIPQKLFRWPSPGGWKTKSQKKVGLFFPRVWSLVSFPEQRLSGNPA